MAAGLCADAVFTNIASSSAPNKAANKTWLNRRDGFSIAWLNFNMGTPVYPGLVIKIVDAWCGFDRAFA
jgi:hypothetical protein